MSRHWKVAPMKKDGSIYLVELLMNNNETRWELVHWAAETMIVPQKMNWCNQIGLGMKFKAIISFIEFDVDLKRAIRRLTYKRSNPHPKGN